MKLNLERLTVRLGLKYITVNTNRTVSLSKFNFFKPLRLLIRTYQVPVLVICPMTLSRV